MLQYVACCNAGKATRLRCAARGARCCWLSRDAVQPEKACSRGRACVRRLCGPMYKKLLQKQTWIPAAFWYCACTFSTYMYMHMSTYMSYMYAGLPPV